MATLLIISAEQMPSPTSWTCCVLLVIHSAYWFLFSEFITTITLLCAVDFSLSVCRIITPPAAMISTLASPLCSTSQPVVSSRFINVVSKPFAKRLQYRSLQGILFDGNLVFIHFDVIWYKLLIVILKVQPVLHQIGGFSV